MRKGRTLTGGILLTFGFIGLFLVRPVSFTSAIEPTSPWLSVAEPPLVKVKDLAPSEYDANSTSNRDCQQREIITRPKRLLPIPQTKQSHISCVVDTSYGAYSASGYLQLAGSSVSGTLKTSAGASVTMIPVPRSTIGISLASGPPYGHNLYFWDNLQTSISSTALADGKINHKLPAVQPEALRDKAGYLLPVDVYSMAFSANGEWMVADIPNVANVRINVRTRQILPFGDSANYRIAGAAFVTAISPDGRYAAAANKSSGTFRIYDLSTCAPVPDRITGKVACNYRDLLPLINHQIPNFNNVSAIRFNSDYSLDLYVGAKVNGLNQISRFSLTAAGQEVAGFQYMALGDSFASGEGAYQYKASTDTDQNKCHLSQRSYPYLMSSVLGFGEYESVACSGAKIEDFLRDDKEYGGQARDGKTLANRDLNQFLNDFLPGFIRQIEFPNRYRPKIITVSAVGNDIGFSDKIIRCIDTDTCYSSYEDRLEIVNEINSQYYRLTDLYTKLKQSGDPSSRIYAIGYPQIGDSAGNCAANVHLNHQELLFAQQLINYLNSVIRTAADYSGVTYVDIENALDGHKLCETHSWNVAVNGLTLGNDIVNIPFFHGPIGNESFHPNALGHELMKLKILQQTNNLTLPMPTANPTLLLPEPPDTLPFLQAPKSNRAIRSIKKHTGTNGGAIEIGKEWVTKYTGLAPAVKAFSTVEAWLNSTPVKLGSFTTDEFGEVTIHFSLPDTVPPGFHTLHLYTTNSSGEDLDFYETVFVAPENTSVCQVVVDSTLDNDLDGVDDACDPFIDETPAISALSEEKPSENNPETVTGNEIIDESAEDSALLTLGSSTSQPTDTSISDSDDNESVLSAITPSHSRPNSASSESQQSTANETAETNSKSWPLMGLVISAFLIALVYGIWKLIVASETEANNI